MTLIFDKIIGHTLLNEGGYVNHKDDRGGPTNYGITEKTLRKAIKKGIVPRGTTVKNLSKEQAICIYKEFYWTPLKIEDIRTLSIVRKVFDTSVNVGLRWGIKILQRAVRSAAGDKLVIDGISGPKTISAVNASPKASLLAAYRSEQAGYYRSIVTKIPKQRSFLNGWLKRAYL